jgi:hypothetical protein
MKVFISLLSLLAIATPAQAITWEEFWDPFTSDRVYVTPSYRPRYYEENEYCTRYTYREEYIPGNIHRPGYVRRYRDNYRVPC